MSDYKRFLSYIYAYDGDYKMNGCGFAKMEVRDSRYRLTVNLNCPLSGQGKEYRVGVYKSTGEEPEVVDIGGLEARSSGYVFSITETVQSFAKGRIGIENAGGLVVYREPGSRLYITSWTDPFVEVRLLRDGIYRAKSGFAPVKEVSEDISTENDKNPETMIEYNNLETAIEYKNSEIIIEYKRPDKENASVENIELIKEEPQVQNVVTVNDYESDVRINDNIKTDEELERVENYNNKEPEVKHENITENNQVSEDANIHSTDRVLNSENEFIKNLAQLGRAVKSEEAVYSSNKESELKAAADSFRNDMAEIDREISEQKKLEESQLKTAEVGELWHEFKRMYPKLRLFSEDGWEVLQIKLQDIGRLSRENWILGNNNFVLHGYYRYGYLILARKHKPEMDVYVLGVPGTFSINEKFMASMFGMSEFMASESKRPDLPKNYGYWCTHIRM